MSSDQYSEKPLPPDKKRCPYCGDIVPANAAICQRCLKALGIREGFPPAKSEPERNTSSAKYAVMAFVACLVIVVYALVARTPGILFLLVFAVPALFHTLVGRPVATEPNRFEVFLATLVLIITIFVASAIAFTVACFAVGFGVVAFAGRLDEDGWFLICPVTSGLVAACLIAAWIIYANADTDTTP